MSNSFTVLTISLLIAVVSAIHASPIHKLTQHQPSAATAVSSAAAPNPYSHFCGTSGAGAGCDPYCQDSSDNKCACVTSGPWGAINRCYCTNYCPPGSPPTATAAADTNTDSRQLIEEIKEVVKEATETKPTEVVSSPDPAYPLNCGHGGSVGCDASCVDSADNKCECIASGPWSYSFCFCSNYCPAAKTVVGHNHLITAIKEMVAAAVESKSTQVATPDPYSHYCGTTGTGAGCDPSCQSSADNQCECITSGPFGAINKCYCTNYCPTTTKVVTAPESAAPVSVSSDSDPYQYFCGNGSEEGCAASCQSSSDNACECRSKVWGALNQCYCTNYCPKSHNNKHNPLKKLQK